MTAAAAYAKRSFRRRIRQTSGPQAQPAAGVTPGVSARQFRQGIKDLKAEVVKVNDKVGNLKDEVVKIEARLTASATKNKEELTAAATKDTEELIAAATKDKEELTKALKKTEDKLTAKNEELSKDISKTAFVTGNIITGGSILVALLTLLSNFDLSFLQKKIAEVTWLLFLSSFCHPFSYYAAPLPLNLDTSHGPAVKV
jgi:hypothetical protein